MSQCLLPQGFLEQIGHSVHNSRHFKLGFALAEVTHEAVQRLDLNIGVDDKVFNTKNGLLKLQRNGSYALNLLMEPQHQSCGYQTNVRLLS